VNAAVVGSWVLITIGAVTLLMALWLTFKQANLKFIIIAWAFGLAATGSGTFGPDFLEHYGALIKPLVDMLKIPNAQTYSTFFQEVATGKVPAGQSDLGLSYALENPVEGMDSLLAEAERVAVDVAAREKLVAARTDLRLKAAAAAALLGPLEEMGPPVLLDSVSAAKLARPLMALPDSALLRLEVDRDVLRERVY
jgi:hypothetical protein